MVLVAIGYVGSASTVEGAAGSWVSGKLWAEPVAVVWDGIPAVDALADLADRLQQPIWMADNIRQQCGKTQVYFSARHLNGFQLMGVLCRIAGLNWAPSEGVVVLTDSSKTPTAWRLSGAACKARILKDHPEWSRVDAARSSADLDLVDVTPSAAVAALGTAYSVPVWLDPRLSESQSLVTVRGQAVPLAKAMEEFAAQLNAQLVQADGVYWVQAEVRAPRLPSITTRVGRSSASEGRVWQSLDNGASRAEGWTDEIQPVRDWFGRRP